MIMLIRLPEPYVEVRSVKISYRDDFRGMLDSLSQRFTALTPDLRRSTMVRYSAKYAGTSEGRLQLDLLRESFDSGKFEAAVRRILAFPHEKASRISETVDSTRVRVWTPSAIGSACFP